MLIPSPMLYFVFVFVFFNFFFLNTLFSSIFGIFCWCYVATLKEDLLSSDCRYVNTQDESGWLDIENSQKALVAITGINKSICSWLSTDILPWTWLPLSSISADISVPRLNFSHLSFKLLWNYLAKHAGPKLPLTMKSASASVREA